MNELSAILESDSFSSSKRCRDFLEFVVKHTLAGDHESLTERFLGVELFGRAVDYETATDSIVRVRANDVRRRLAQYYAVRGNDVPVRIDLMAGGYIPEFHWRNAEAQVAPPVPQAEIQPMPAIVEAQPPHHRSRLLLWSSVAIALAVLAAVAVSFSLRPRPTNFDLFWQPVLNVSVAPVLSLPGSDTFQFQPDALRQFSQQKPDHSAKFGASDVVAFHNWHVSMPVLQAALAVALTLDRKGKTPLVRMGADLRTDEVLGHPVIAIGSFSNPWTQQNVTGLRFTFDRGVTDKEAPRIRDTLDSQRSWVLPSTYPEPQTRDYAIVTRTFDPATREPFVSLAGLHSFGNQIAAEFVSQPSFWDEVAQRAPANWEKMNLQIVLEANVIGTTPGPPRIVASYFWR